MHYANKNQLHQTHSFDNETQLSTPGMMNFLTRQPSLLS